MFKNLRGSRAIFVYGGLFAALILVVAGAASVVIGIQGRADVRDMLADEKIVGTEDSDIAGQKVDTGSEAKEFADTIRGHALAQTGGLTYSEMGRFATADGDPAGTNDATLAVTDANGAPVANPGRDTWITATALTTSLNTAYFAEQVGLFSIVLGIALVLTGIGFAVLVWGVFLHTNDEAAEAAANAGMQKAAPQV